MKTLKKLLFTISIICAFCLVGCKIVTKEGARKDVSYQICDATKAPDELRKIIEEKKKKMFKLTYVAGDNIYICFGYGEKNSSDYAVCINDIFETENAVYVDADLKGATATGSDCERATSSDSDRFSMCPYIIIKCEKFEKPVVFNID